VRIPRTVKVRLGYKPKGKNYPQDTDVFVGRIEDGVTKEILEAYNGERIADADGEAWSLGKALRLLSYFEWDERSPQDPDKELVVELANRAWAHSKLRCVGNGGDLAGTASAADKAWADEISKATKEKPRELDNGRFQIVCLGPKCPKWHSNLATDKSATCHHELRLRARLLHPATNPADPNYLKQLGWVEVASGSWNGMIDIQSGLSMLRGVAGRSAGIPFFLRRTPRTVLSDGKRLTKATMIVDYDHDEAIRFGYSDPKLSLVRPEVRKQLVADRKELLELARLEANYDSFKDIQPRLEEHVELRPREAASMHQSSIDAAPDVVADRDQVVDDAAAAPPAPSEDELNRFLTQGERDELKVLCGGEPGNAASLAHFRDLVYLAYKHFEEWLPAWDNASPPLSSLKLKHALWIREAIEAEKAA
jgi:recombination directionality factor gp3-like protein